MLDSVFQPSVRCKLAVVVSDLLCQFELCSFCSVFQVDTISSSVSSQVVVLSLTSVTIDPQRGDQGERQDVGLFVLCVYFISGLYSVVGLLYLID